MFRSFLADHHVDVAAPPGGMKRVALADEATITKVREADLKDSFLPDSFYEFSRDIGSGRLGRAYIYCVTPYIGHSYSIVRQVGFVQHRLSSIKFAHSFNVREKLTAFAKDAQEDFVFAFDEQHRVYAYELSERAAPPRRVAESFEAFLLNVALGDVMNQMELFKTKDVSDGEEEEDEEDAEGAHRALPPRVFVPAGDGF